jgi:archaellin
MAAIIASIAALVLIGTTFYALASAARARGKQKRQVALEAAILEFKPRQRQQANSSR